MIYGGPEFDDDHTAKIRAKGIWPLIKIIFVFLPYPGPTRDDCKDDPQGRHRYKGGDNNQPRPKASGILLHQLLGKRHRMGQKSASNAPQSPKAKEGTNLQEDRAFICMSTSPLSDLKQ